MAKRNEKLTVLGKQALQDSIIYYNDCPVGTVAARDSSSDPLNYDQCFMRDFIPCGITFLMQGETEIVRHFLTETLKLQIKQRQLDFLEPGRGIMPASFKVSYQQEKQYLKADFGNDAIGRVTPVDSGLWWLFLLRSYVKYTNDYAFSHSSEVQKCIRLIMELCLSARFDMFPTLLVPDGSCMIDRRMGIEGYPLEIQSLFYMALKVASELLLDTEENDRINKAVHNRLNPLATHIRQNYWLDLTQMNTIYRYKGEEYGEGALNQFNIYSDSIPYTQLSEWLPEDGGYLAGNLGPSLLDCRFFSLGNLVAILSSLTENWQSQAIMNVIEQKWEDLIGYMPMKICFPALKDRDWQLITGCDPKNRPWSYHNGGNWPVLLWLLVASAIKTQRVELGQRAIEIAAKRLLKDEWPEYYDGKNGRLVGKEARKYQTWTIAGFLVAQGLMENPQFLEYISFE
ncbi:glycoside hydrolase 100 family protein [Gloeothece verrucosa]|uniref:beta-fructofuranosidase n=1 Tax=Gloeothece verrucosa (strain PCC 7822) TaxID=497965 RepID=E0U886_GLOV7|nr:glycoside hydrolase 100 family protein [Gloeothece verrucosa]ADN17291.1 neutral invertase [Gloeothece verrucosa PCC 7822]